MREANEKVEAVQRGHVVVAGSVPIEAQESTIATKVQDDPDEIETRQSIGESLDGFLFPGHHRVSGGWDGPDD